MEQYTYCRICRMGHGMICHTLDNGEVLLKSDPNDPFSLGTICQASQNSQKARISPERLRSPQKRNGDQWEDVSWEQALREIGATLQNNPSREKIGLYIGQHAMRRSADFVRSLSFGVAHGLTNIFSTLCLDSGPKRLGAEWCLGYGAELLSDLGRAHHILLLGSDPHDAGWAQEGTLYDTLIQHSRRTKKTKVTSLSAYKGSFADTIDRYVPIRPGTEPFLLLGMIHVTLKSGWADFQYVQDYTTHLEEIVPLLEKWDVQRCADICGIKAAEFSGIALKFSRAAMGIVHPGSGTFHNENSALGAWAWMIIHMITANALRPGGIYENIGGFDLYPFLTNLNMRDAPTSKATKHPVQLMQTPASAIPESDVNMLICLGDIPPALQRKSLKKALQGMELLVACDQSPNWISKWAHWRLPSTHPLEESDSFFHLNPSLPCNALPRSAPVFPPPEQVKTFDDILQQLSNHFKTSWSGPWGYHLKGASRMLLHADLDRWIERLLDFGISEELPNSPGHRFQGETDRTLWRPENNRLEFFSPTIAQLIKEAVPPQTSDQYPFLIHASGYVDDAPDDAHRATALSKIAIMNPDSGIPEGTVTVTSEYGSITLKIKHDPRIRNDVLRAPVESIPEIMEILPDAFAAHTGSPILDGIACRVTAN
ncbi:MAG: molybdopterin-dependent oxidoreductase [Myxococcota bacterium]|nr:molybdopterin-dependent oxidoreductase [Myxococcota bacterium]